MKASKAIPASVKVKIAISILWGLVAFLLGMAAGKENTYSFQFSAFLVVFLMACLPLISYWLGYWIWGDGYLWKTVSWPFRWLMKPNPRFKRKGIEAERPWFRYFARMLDYSVWAIMLGFVLGFTSALWPNAFGDYMFNGAGSNVAWNLLATLTWVPVEAVVIALWGSTLGKAAFGIRVESGDGKAIQPLTMAKSFRRALGVYTWGIGLGVPLVTLFTMWWSYRHLSKAEPLNWEKQSQTRSRYEGVRWWLLLVLVALVASAVYLGLRSESQQRNIRNFEASIKQYPAQRTEALQAYSDGVSGYINDDFNPNSFACSVNMPKCRAAVQNARNLLEKTREKINDTFLYTDIEINSLDAPHTYKAGFNSAYLPGKQKTLMNLDKLYAVENQFFDLLEAKLNFLNPAQHPFTWAGGAVMFADPRDAEVFNNFDAKIGEIAAKELEILAELQGGKSPPAR